MPIARIAGIVVVVAHASGAGAAGAPPVGAQPRHFLPADGAVDVPLNARLVVRDVGGVGLRGTVLVGGDAIAVGDIPFDGLPLALAPDALHEVAIDDGEVVRTHSFTTSTTTDGEPPRIEGDVVTGPLVDDDAADGARGFASELPVPVDESGVRRLALFDAADDDRSAPLDAVGAVDEGRVVFRYVLDVQPFERERELALVATDICGNESDAFFVVALQPQGCASVPASPVVAIGLLALLRGCYRRRR